MIATSTVELETDRSKSERVTGDEDTGVTAEVTTTLSEDILGASDVDTWATFELDLICTDEDSSIMFDDISIGCPDV